MEKCNILFSKDEPSLQDEDGFLKPCAHNDSHVFRNYDGKLIEWEDDYSCTCGCWDDDYDEDFVLSKDQSLDVNGASYDFELDEQFDCAESCEPF